MSDVRAVASALQPADGLDVLVLVDNTTDSLSSRPEGVRTELAGLRERGVEEVTGEQTCCAHHGLSLLITAHTADGSRTVLFDGGPEGATLERNVARLGADLGSVDAVVLSHGHWDHGGGLLAAVRAIHAANGGRRVPYHTHAGMFPQAGRKLPSGDIMAFEPVPDAAHLEAAGAEVHDEPAPHTLAGDLFFISGEIPRVTPYERGLSNHVRRDRRGDAWAPDPLIMDERFLAVHVRDKGLVVFSACSHAGIVNVLTHAREAFAPAPLHAAMGGLHLSGSNMEPIIPDTVRDLGRLELRRIVAGHCTGWRALAALLAAFGDEVLVPSAVGTRFSF